MNSVLGSVGMSGMALTNGIVILAGLRGSDRIKLNRDKAGGLGIAFGTLAVAAGSMWAVVAKGISQVPTALIQGDTFGDIGLGGAALALTVTTFVFKWKAKIWPTLLGISAGVIYAQAGGMWSIGHNVALKLAAALASL